MSIKVVFRKCQLVLQECYLFISILNTRLVLDLWILLICDRNTVRIGISQFFSVWKVFCCVFQCFLVVSFSCLCSSVLSSPSFCHFLRLWSAYITKLPLSPVSIVTAADNLLTSPVLMVPQLISLISLALLSSSPCPVSSLSPWVIYEISCCHVNIFVMFVQ